MPICPLQEMLRQARHDGYALCYCESWNLESLQAVVMAAEECRSPIIAGFNGGFLQHVSRKHPENLSYYAGMRLALEAVSVPVAFLLNESTSLQQMEEGIRLGFNAVMPDNEGLSPEGYKELVTDVVHSAHPKSVWVEAQVGRLPAGSPSSDGHALITDPDVAAEFVAETGVDALSVSVGNVHILTDGVASIDFDMLERIRQKATIPLAIHGGTSLTPETLRRLVSLGVSKFNFGTVLKQAYLDAVSVSLSRYQWPASPHEYLGIGGDQDIMVAGREAVKAKVKELLRVCNSEGTMAYDFSTGV
jgi:ketose-bisphosphate aldolase